MTREELHQIVLTEISAIDTDTGNPDADTAQLVSRLWPVLAQVWEEGYGDAYDDAHDLSRLHPTINPYGEVSA